MNPLNRRMFRQPGMSRQPAGILASSPQLANTVANRQPVRMANGGANTVNRGFIPDMLSRYATQSVSGSGDANERAFRSTSGMIPLAIEGLANRFAAPDVSGSADANERAFRSGEVKPQLGNISEKLMNVLRKYPKSGFAKGFLEDLVLRSREEQDAVADKLEQQAQGSSGISSLEALSGLYADGMGVPNNVTDAAVAESTPQDKYADKGSLPSELTTGVMSGGAPRFNPDGMSSQEDLGRGSRESDLMGSKDDTQFFGPGETLSNEVVDFETNPDKKDAGDDEDGMPVPTSKPKRKESPEVKVKKLDKLADAEVMGTDLDKMFVGEVGSILNSDVSEEEKNDSILEVMGEKDPKKKLTMEERVKKNIALYEKYFPEDDADKFDMNDFAISFGLALATGESPDLITNAANAAKTALGEKAESDKTRKTRKDKLRMLGLTKAFDDEKDEKQWSRELEKINRNEKYDWKKTLFKNKKDAERFDAKMAFDKTSLYAKLNTQIDIANANADNQAIREEASQAAALIRAKIGALSDAHAAAYIEFEGQDFTNPDVAAAFHKKADEIADSLAKTSSRFNKDYTKRRIEFEIAEAIADRVKAEVAIGNTNPDVTKITKEIRDIYDKALQGAGNISTQNTSKKPTDGFGEMTTTN